jgi:FtsH-binding integral membrane protein
MNNVLLVYGILFLQLILTVASLLTARELKWNVENYFIPLIFISFALLFIRNLPSLLLFSIVSGLLFSVYSYPLTNKQILVPFFATVCILGIVSLIAYYTPHWIDTLHPYLFYTLLALVIVGIGMLFIPVPTITYEIYNLFGLVFFMIFLLYDSHILMHHPIHPVDSVFNMYLDFINIFVRLLRY